MINTQIISEISADKYEYAAKKILYHTPKFLCIITLVALSTLVLLYAAFSPLLSGGKINIGCLIMSVIAVIVFIRCVTFDRMLKARRKILIETTGSDSSVTEMTFGETCITNIFQGGKSKKNYMYADLKYLYVFPETVVISGNEGSIYISRSDIPDYDELKRFLLEKNPGVKEKHLS